MQEGMPARPDEMLGRVVVVTGAARGMGRAYVQAFLERGASVVGLDRSWGGESVQSGAQRTLMLTCDVTRTADVTRACSKAVDRFGTVDVLINNAAMRQRDLYPPHGASTVLDTQDEHWQRMFEVNVVGVLKVIREFVQPMQRQARGSIVNIASGGSVGVQLQEGVWVGRNPAFRNEPYDASKAALTNMSFFLAEELKPHGIAVNVVFPSGTRTTGSDEMVAGRNALGMRVSSLLKPEHVVPLVLHLSSQDAAGETGRAFDAVHWNASHGLGGPEAWLAHQSG